MKKAKLPKTDSIQALAKFWDTHDLTDFEGELEEVSEPVFMRAGAAMKSTTRRMPKEVVNVPFQAPEAEVIKRMARSKGISPGQLVRTWVLKKIADRSNGRSVKR